MSDAYAIVAFSGDLSDDEGASALESAETALRGAGLVVGNDDPEAILGTGAALVLRPGRTIERSHEHISQLMTMLTNGVAFRGPNYFNPWALVNSSWYECPACNEKVSQNSSGHSEVLDGLGNAAASLVEGEQDIAVACPNCNDASDVREWHLEDPVFLADIAFEFWNWPPFERGASTESRAQGATLWDVDVLAVLEGAVGRPARQSWVRI